MEHLGLIRDVVSIFILILMIDSWYRWTSMVILRFGKQKSVSMSWDKTHVKTKFRWFIIPIGIGMILIGWMNLLGIISGVGLIMVGVLDRINNKKIRTPHIICATTGAVAGVLSTIFSISIIGNIGISIEYGWHYVLLMSLIMLLVFAYRISTCDRYTKADGVKNTLMWNIEDAVFWGTAMTLLVQRVESIVSYIFIQ